MEDFIVIESYDDAIKYINDVINDKEHRSPIFKGDGQSGKSMLFRMIQNGVQNGDIDETKIKEYLS
jgi:ABC-type phosphate/phosphonate transport system ATPase subunit